MQIRIHWHICVVFSFVSPLEDNGSGIIITVSMDAISTQTMVMTMERASERLIKTSPSKGKVSLVLSCSGLKLVSWLKSLLKGNRVATFGW